MKSKFTLSLICAAIAASSSLLSVRAADAPDGKKPKPEFQGKRHGEHRGKSSGQHSKMKGQNGSGMMMQDLHLTDEQKEKVKAIMESKKPQFEALRKQQMQKMKAIMEEVQMEIRPLLTPAQVQVLDNTTKLEEARANLQESRQKLNKSQAAKKSP